MKGGGASFAEGRYLQHARESARLLTHAKSLGPATLPHTMSTRDRTNSWGPAKHPIHALERPMHTQRVPGRKCEPNGDL